MMSFGWSAKSAPTTEQISTSNETNPMSEVTPIDSNYSSISNSYTTDPYTNRAKVVSEQIAEDKTECRSIISEYGLDPNEFLHLLENWTQKLLLQYKFNREHYKLVLKDKWERGELKGLQSDDDSTHRLLHLHVQKLNLWKNEGLGELKRQFDELKDDMNIKELTNQSIDDLLQIMSSILILHQKFLQNNRQKTYSNYLNETTEQLKRLQQFNQKDFYTICIIGLEKAGKSSFINALLGFHLLPSDINRCTQIQTILKPISQQNPHLFATIEFYNDTEFESLIRNLPKDKDETDEIYQKRVQTIVQTRENLQLKNHFLQNHQLTDTNRQENILRDLHKFIANELYLTIVKHVTIYTNKLPGENYILLDVPGCDSPLVEHRTSALNAIRNADAFLFLTDGQRPSLTNEQIRLLNEIQSEHFEGMKRAFGIITKLDLCQTQLKYREHLIKTKLELEQKGFLAEQIFPVAANIELLEQTNSDRDLLTKLHEHIKPYEQLTDGFNRCKQALTHYIEYQLPSSHFRQVINISQQKIFRYVQETLKLTEQILPSDLKDKSLDDYFKQIQSEKWNEIFENERYQPVLAKASYWQKETLALKRNESTKDLSEYFSQQFQCLTEDIITKSHPIEQVMLQQHEISIFQMNPYDIETKEREKLVQYMFDIIEQTSKELAIYMFEKYLNHLEKLLNNICIEQGDLFRSHLTLEHCIIQVQTLITRVTHPIIIATIRWPRVYEENRLESAKELTRIAPMVAFNIWENHQKQASTYLGKVLDTIFDGLMTNKTQSGILMTLFRR